MSRLVVFFYLAVGLEACSYDHAKDEADGNLPNIDTLIIDSTHTCDSISFKDDVFPIFEAHCNFNNCHAYPNGKAGVFFETHTDIRYTTGAILGALSQEDRTKMPWDSVTNTPAPKLPDSLIQIIACWSRQGRLNN